MFYYKKAICALILLFVISISIAVITIYIHINPKENQNYKYDISKEVGDYSFNNDIDYRDYLKDISRIIEPHELVRFIDYDSFYFSQKFDNFKTGNEQIVPLIKDAYNNLINYIVQPNQDWSNLPLTENFRKKFNERDGVIKECDYNYKSISKYSYDNKTFSIDYDWVPDDAHEKYTDDEIEFMLTYGAGAYNLDRYNYEFVLDDKGYLDDIVFLGITPVIVEGCDLEHPENNLWHDGDE